MNQEMCARNQILLRLSGCDAQEETKTRPCTGRASRLGDVENGAGEEDGPGLAGGHTAREFAGGRALPMPVVEGPGGHKEHREPWQPAGRQ